MADTQLNLKISDGGTLKPLISGSETFKNNMQAGAAALSKGRMPGAPVRAPRAGYAPAGPAPTGGGGSGMGQELTSYGISRSAVGTGAAGRDFAQQAQGLGGLVHLYATFAANLFAAGAAFRALSNAMDASNLVKGLDQIGAASGKNLGSLARQMVAATDGAISLQQAMGSTAMATAGGMTNQQVLKMTEVAKKASLALGRDLTDSMDRLTKGIVKTQPELLDELGIMTRMIPAQQAYGREIGKSISELTDFEKRQAFANAVLKEGEAKFKDINLEANSYTRVLAGVKNTMQSALEGINTLLNPILTMLAESPTGLAIALTAIAGILIKQAVPALGMFRDNARRMQEESHMRLRMQVKDQSDALDEINAEVSSAAEKRFKTENLAAEKIKQLKTRFSAATLGTEVSALVKKSPYDLTGQDIRQIEAKQADLADRIQRGIATKSEKANEKQLRANIILYNDIYAAKEEAAMKAQELDENTQKKLGTWQDIQQRRVKALTKAEQKYKALQGATDDAAILGPSLAFARLKDNLKGVDGVVAKTTTAIRGSLTIATTYIGGLMQAFSGVMMIIGLVTAGFALLDSWLSKSKKEASAFNDAISETDSASKNIARTLEVINNKDLGEALSIKSTQARANAFNNLATSVATLTDKFEKLIKAQGDWDRFKDSILTVFGKGNADDMAVALGSTVSSAFEALEEGPVKRKAEEALSKLFNANPEQTAKVIANLKRLGLEGIIEKSKQYTKVIAEIDRASMNSAQNLTAFQESIKKIGLGFTDITNALIPSDNISKLGMDLGIAAGQLQVASNNSVDSLKGLLELSEDMKTLSLVPGGEALGKDLQKLKTFATEIDRIDKDIRKKREERDEILMGLGAQERLVNSSGVMTRPGEAARLKGMQDDANKLDRAVQSLRDARIIAEKNIESLTTKANTYAKELAEASYQYLSRGLQKAVTEAAISLAKDISGVLKGLGAITDVFDAELAKRSIEASIAQINAAYENTRSMVALTLAVEADRLSREKKDAEDSKAKLNSVDNSSDDFAAINKIIEGINTDLAINAKATTALEGGPSAILAVKRNANDPEARKVGAKLQGVTNEIFGMQSQKAIKFAELYTAELNIQLAAITEITKRRQLDLNSTAQSLENEKKKISLMTSLVPFYSSNLQSIKQANEQSILTNKYLKDNETINETITKNELIRDELLNKQSKKKLSEKESKLLKISNEAITNAIIKRGELSAGYEADSAIASTKNLLDQQKGQESLRKAAADRASEELNNTYTLKAANLDIEAGQLAYYEKIGVLSSDFASRQKETLDLQKADLEYKKTTAALQSDYDTKRIAAQETINNLGMLEDGAAPMDAAEAQARLDAVTNGYRSQLDTMNLQLAAKKEMIALESEHERLTKSLVELNESLTAVFGTMGTSLGEMVGTLVKIQATDEKYQKDRLAAQKEMDDAIDPEDSVAAIKKLDKLDKDATKNKLNNDIQLAKSAKGMFKENTAAYKVIDGIEKALHLKKLFFMGLEFATKLGFMTADSAAVIAKEATDATAKIPGVIMEFMKKLGPWGAAAAAVAIAAVLGGKGGGASAPALTAEQQREAGDGQRWTVENGQNVLKDVGGGVWGDTAAKSESIANSIELMKDSVVEGLYYEDKMLKALLSINNHISGTASLLAGIPGISQGSAFGTKEGTNTSGGFLGISGLFSKTSSSEIIDAGLKFTKTFGAVADGMADAMQWYETTRTTTTSSGFFGFGGGTKTSENTIMENMAKKFPEQARAIQDSFKGIEETVVEFGSQLGMSSAVIRNDLNSLDLRDITASLKGLNGQALEDEWGRVLSKIMDRGTKAIFSNIVTDYRKLGEGAAETVARVLNNYTKVNLALKSIGLDPLSDLSKNVQTTVTTISSGFFGMFSRFKNLTANLQNARERAALQKKVFDATEDLVELAGGLDVFLERTQFFRDNFMSDWQKETIMQDSVTRGMAELGLASITTKEQFSQLYLSLDILDPAARELRTSMDEIAPSFIEVANAAKKLQDSTESLLSKVYGLLGNDDKVLAMARAKELEGTDERLKSLQEYVYALEDLEKAQNALEKAQDALDKLTIKSVQETQNVYKDQISTLDSFVKSAEGYITSLLKLKDSLALGGQSTLTPSAKYSEARSQFSTALMGANKAIDFTASKEEIDRQTKEKADAINSVQSLASTFLDASKTYNASSSQYTSDYSYIQAALSSTASTLEAQKFSAMTALDYARAQDTKLQSQLDVLNNVDKSTTDTNTLISNLKTAWDTAEAARAVWQADSLGYTEGQKAAAADIVSSVNAANAAIVSAITGEAIPTFATGGLASRGFAIVGEQGPELVNFQNPGMVYTAEQTLGMFSGGTSSNSNAQMVNELRALRQEVAALRQQQSTETGHLINATYEAQTQNADAVSQAVLENGKKQIWDAKVKQTVKLA